MGRNWHLPRNHLLPNSLRLSLMAVFLKGNKDPEGLPILSMGEGGRSKGKCIFSPYIPDAFPGSFHFIITNNPERKFLSPFYR